jgi:hypothetical protein
MEVVQQHEQRLHAPPLKEAEHAVEARRSRISSKNDRTALGLDRAMAAEIIERLAENAERQGSFRGITVALAHCECGPSEQAGMVEHRRLSQTRFGHEEEHAATPSAGLVQRRADRRRRGFALPNRMPHFNPQG